MGFPNEALVIDCFGASLRVVRWRRVGRLGMLLVGMARRMFCRGWSARAWRNRFREW